MPLIALLAATSFASVMACGSDAKDAEQKVEPLATEPVQIPARELPPVEAAAPAATPEPRGDAPNGVSLPDGILDWRVIGVVSVPDNPMMDGNQATLRVIVGNATAVTAARAGETNPWPEGSMIGHFQWTSGSNPYFANVVAPGDFARITLMEKSSARFAADNDWAFGVWAGPNLTPPPPAAPGAQAFDRVCVNCHTDNVLANDMVFTIPAPLPAQAAVDAAPAMANGIELPADILDWRVIGASTREADMVPTIRVIVGNDIAVEAARAGKTNPWPDGSMLAHYVWAIGDNNPNSTDTVNAATFAAFTLEVKDATKYAADNGWAFGNWTTPALTAPADPAFDRACVSCHATSVGAVNDFVFTKPGKLPTELFPPLPEAL